LYDVDFVQADDAHHLLALLQLARTLDKLGGGALWQEGWGAWRDESIERGMHVY
jgi:hypothetical protein